MPLTAKEKMRRYREKLKKENPEKYEEQRKKNLNRIKSKKKKIKEMGPAEAEAKRREWREEKRINRQRHHDMNRPATLREKLSDSEKNGKTNKTPKEKRLQKKLTLALKHCKNYNVQIGKLTAKVVCYKKRIQRLKSKTNISISKLEKSLEKCKARNEVLESTIKTSFQTCKKVSEKQVMRKVIHNSKNKQYASKVLGLKVTARQKPQKLRENNEISEIKNFYLRDDVSRNTSGKKECRVKNKQKKQIRYLIDSLSHIYRKYKAEGGRYGITKFYENKPFFVLSPHIQSRSTCLCEKHDNIKFKYEVLKKHRILNKGFNELLQEIVCDTKNVACMYNSCSECKNKTPESVKDQELLQKTVKWSQWERQTHEYTKNGVKTKTTKTVRAVKADTGCSLMTNFSSDMMSFKKHHFNHIHQQTEYKKAITDMKETEAIIICDFSENYTCKLTEEIQSMHFGASKSQISLHTGMIYLKNESQSFCTMSDNLTHQPPAIWAHLTPILATVKEKCPDLDVIHFFSDGPSSQYRQKNNFFLHSLFTKELSLSYSTWSYFEAGHGKSVADGIGGTIKRMLDFKVCHGTDIENAKDAYEALKRTNTVINVHLIEEEAVNQITNRIPDGIQVLPGTMKLHQIIACDGVNIKYRDISCFCEPLRGNCSCYSPRQHTLQSSNSTNKSNNNKKHEQSLPRPEIKAKAIITAPLVESYQNDDVDTNLFDTADMRDMIDAVESLNRTTPASAVKLIVAESKEGSSQFDIEETALPDTDDMRAMDDDVDLFISKTLDINTLPMIILQDKVSMSPDQSITEYDVISADKSSPTRIPEIKPNKNESKVIRKCEKSTKTTTNETKVKKHDMKTRQKPVQNNETNVKKHDMKTRQQPVRKNQNIKFLLCNKCKCSILGPKTKCMACKKFYCDDCVVNPTFIDFLCDTCLQTCDED